MDKRTLVADRVRNAVNRLRAELRPSGINLDDVEVRDTATGVEVVVGSIKASKATPTPDPSPIKGEGKYSRSKGYTQKTSVKQVDEPDDPPVEDEGADE